MKVLVLFLLVGSLLIDVGFEFGLLLVHAVMSWFWAPILFPYDSLLFLKENAWVVVDSSYGGVVDVEELYFSSADAFEQFASSFCELFCDVAFPTCVDPGCGNPDKVCFELCEKCVSVCSELW